MWYYNKQRIFHIGSLMMGRVDKDSGIQKVAGWCEADAGFNEDHPGESMAMIQHGQYLHDREWRRIGSRCIMNKNFKNYASLFNRS